MSQASVILPTAGVVSGLTFANDANAAYDAIRTLWSGASAPSADIAEEGQRWLDTSVAGYATYRVYDGSQWLAVFVIDLTNHAIVSAASGGGYRPIIDSDYTATIYDRFIAYNGLTAARTVTLPLAASFPPGVPLIILDHTGNCSSVVSITPTPSGSDAINAPPGERTTLTLPYAYVTLVTDGATQWLPIGHTIPPALPGGGF